MRLAAYVYPGWHPTPERDASFRPGFTEWELVAACRPRFPGHAQPRVPLFGPYDDRDPVEVGRRVRLATAHGVDAFVHGFFWCRGKRVFQDALDLGFLGSDEGSRAPFALMWANRMPRRVLPVARADLPVIEEDRLVLQHYCSAGNQPRLVSTGLDGHEIRFTFERATNLPSIGIGHIHAAVFTFPGTGPFTSRWTWLADGVETTSTRRHERAK